MPRANLDIETKAPGINVARAAVWGMGLATATLTGGLSLLVPAFMEGIFRKASRDVSDLAESESIHHIDEVGEEIKDRVGRGERSGEINHKVDLSEHGFGGVSRRYRFSYDD